MIARIMLAVDDTPDSLAAARVAAELACALQADLRVVHVSTNHDLDAAVTQAGGHGAVAARRAESDAAILARAVALAAHAGVKAETDLLTGDTAPAVLEAARAWSADLVVLGKSARSATGEPYIGSRARHILEFAEQPVLIVPPRPRA